jgi:transposase
MYRDSNFSSLVKLFPRDILQNSTTLYQGDRYAKRFTCHSHLMVMIYAHISEAKSLRDIEFGYNEQVSSHYHLRSSPVYRSTLAAANSRRDPRVFMEVAQAMMSQIKRGCRKELSEIIELIDSSPIPLSGRGFDDWTTICRTKRTQGLKLHFAMDGNSHMPRGLELSPANVNDINVAREWPVCEAVTYVFDKGYCDYNWWWKLNESKAFFVTRLKKNASITVTGNHAACSKPIIADETILLRNKQPRGGKQNNYVKELRRITVERPEKDTSLILVTNRFDLTATEVADLYRQRWQIELMFKWLKQRLKIRNFIGRSENAVKIQLITAIITYMLLSLYKTLLQEKSSMYEFLIKLKATLFYRKQKNYYKEKQQKDEYCKQNQLELVYG